MKINIGCGGRPLLGYINIDSDNINVMKCRYPNTNFSDDLKIYDYDIFNLPFKDNSISEARADSLIEHLSFKEEPLFFYEIKRVLKSGGKFYFSTTNFEKIIKLWLKADDNWKDFFRDDADAIKNQHWFGQNSYSMNTRWGYLCASIYGSQNGSGQFHKNCYSIQKIKAILNKLNFEEIEITEFQWKGDRDPMINVCAMKKWKE